MEEEELVKPDKQTISPHQHSQSMQVGSWQDK